MKLEQLPAPHIRHEESNFTMMAVVTLALACLMLTATLYYGLRALTVCGVSVLSAVLADAACVLFRGRPLNPRDLSPVVTGLIIALVMPVTISYYVLVVAAMFSILVAKHPFGGTGNNLFNPAAAGFSFVAICWPEQVFYYPVPRDFGIFTNKLSIFGTYSKELGAFVSAGELGETIVTKLYQNPSFVLKQGGIPSFGSLEDLITGNYPGPMGATNLLVILTCLILLLPLRTVRWQLPVAYLGACVLMAYLFPRAGADGAMSIIYELSAGALLFGAVFMVGDPVTSPKRTILVVVYGAFAGMITMLFRYFGGFEESVPFAILFANAFVPVIDRHGESLHRLIRRKRFEAKKSKGAPSI